MDLEAFSSGLKKDERVMTEREQKKIISSEIQIEEPDDFVVTRMLDINSSLPADSP